MAVMAIVGLVIVVVAALGQLGTILTVTRAAMRGRQASWMAPAVFGLAGAILFGGGLIAASVDLLVAQAVGFAMMVSGLGVTAYSASALRRARVPRV